MEMALRDDASLWKGAVAGAAGGLVASFAMNQFQGLLKTLAEGWEEGGQKPKKGQGQKKKKQAKGGGSGDDATVKAASAISETAFDHQLSREEKKAAGPAVHYAFGTVTGGVYGALSERWPRLARVAGLPFGTAVWLGADEVAVPALGLSQPPTKSPASVHVQALAAHAVYGLTTEGVRRLLRRVL
jgi:putative membrane protein